MKKHPLRRRKSLRKARWKKQAKRFCDHFIAFMTTEYWHHMEANDEAIGKMVDEQIRKEVYG